MYQFALLLTERHLLRGVVIKTQRAEVIRDGKDIRQPEASAGSGRKSEGDEYNGSSKANE